MCHPIGKLLGGLIGLRSTYFARIIGIISESLYGQAKVGLWTSESVCEPNDNFIFIAHHFRSRVRSEFVLVWIVEEYVGCIALVSASRSDGLATYEV